jgi:glutamate 5-kinase
MTRPRNLVVKVGTSVLTKDGVFTKSVIQKLAGEMAAFLKAGTRVSIVSSGAIGAGMTLLRQMTRPSTMEGLQAFAAIGQRYLMQCWEEALSKHRFSTAQMLLTRDDLVDEKRRQNAKKTLNEIQHLKHVPIINENDTVATEEIKFGDNDQLSAMLAKLIQADFLVILSDTDGLYDSAGHKISTVAAGDSSIFSHVRDKKSDFTVGGMKSKLEAIRQCTQAGISVTLTSGTTSNLLRRIERNEPFGTRFLA